MATQCSNPPTTKAQIGKKIAHTLPAISLAEVAISTARHVAVFEAPIDALSHATLQELEGWKWNGYRLSLGGTSHVALTSFLERHPEIRCVTLYMDHDLAGFVNARKIKTMLHEDKRFRHIRVSVNPPRMGKDYNEKLLQVREQLQTSQHQRRPKEAAVSI